MTYEQIVAKVKEIMAGKSAADCKEHIAAEFHITGEGEGAFYIEVNDGKIAVEPYEYYDRDFIVTASADDIIAFAEGKSDNVSIDGNNEKADSFKKVCKAVKSVKTANTSAKTAEKPAAKPASKAKSSSKKKGGKK